MQVPIFPLSTVLFPGGRLPLRVFEVRYMDMVRACMRTGTPFGICRITAGNEVGKPADHEAVGCVARISDWDMKDIGVLRITVLGNERFRVLERTIAADGLITGSVQMLADDPLEPVPEQYSACTALLKQVLADIEEKITEHDQRPIVPPYRFDSSAWVGNRLAELLSISANAKQKLMELDDPAVRLSLIDQFLKQSKVISEA
jgi:uncharacterized protein